MCRGLLSGGSTAFELLIIPSDKAKFLFCVVGFVCFICLFQMFDLHLNFYLFVCCSLLAAGFFSKGHLDECLVTLLKFREKNSQPAVYFVLLLFVCLFVLLIGWLVGWLA